MSDYNTFSDWELTSLLKVGDRMAYTEIYKRYTGVLYRHAFSKLHDREEAKDAVQELFAVLWSKRADIFISTTLSGYLYSAIRNRVLNAISHKKVASDYVVSLQEFAGKEESITDHLVRERELANLIEKEISNLPDKMREVFELSRKANLSHREIAQKLDLSEKTVKNQVNNALKILRVKLGSLFFLIFLFYN
ncbi:RNA polymerase sigma-70 factor [Pedobacter frigoris]|uniref:RNA polymerase sigma-70 factor n=1 Tax=Pedobacter frigoris TaxID=2571272 RepID=UPI00292F3BF4|nr:RNA polymerase sigma-70 factor [Pedobacter frigoris]